MAEADQHDLLPRIAVPTLLIWGELDACSPLTVASQFEQAIPYAKLVVIRGAGRVSNLEQPERVDDAVCESAALTRRVPASPGVRAYGASLRPVLPSCPGSLSPHARETLVIDALDLSAP